MILLNLVTMSENIKIELNGIAKTFIESAIFDF